MVLVTVLQEPVNCLPPNHRQVSGRSPSVSPFQFVTILSNLDTLCTSLGYQTLQRKYELKELEIDSRRLLRYNFICYPLLELIWYGF